MKSTSDTLNEMLVIQCQEGKKKAFGMLVNQWNSSVVKQAYWYCKDGSAAKDIAQETWASVVKGLGRLHDPTKFAVWLNRIIYHKSADWIRRQQKARGINQRDVENELYPRQSDQGDNNKIEVMLSLIKTLPDDQRNILTLFYLKEYNVNEIAEILSIPKGTVKSRLFTAREHLKQELKLK
ncbi:MAG: sigma-70 family RNA polymerase sigma factor [Cyclobacteriaceae bacterium]